METKNPFTIRKIGTQNFLGKHKWLTVSLIAVLFATGVSSAFAATTIFDPVTSTPEYTQSESAPTNASTGASGNQPGTSPSTASTVQPTFSGTNIQGYIFNQRSADTTAQQNSVQVLDHMTLWGSLNAHKNIYNSNGALELNDDVNINNKLYVNNIDHLNDSNVNTESVTIDHSTKINGDLRIQSYWDGVALQGGNLDIRRSIYSGTKNDDVGVSVEDPLNLNSNLGFYGTSKNIYGNPRFAGLGTGRPAAIFDGNTDFQGTIKNSTGTENPDALVVDDDLRVNDNLIFKEPWTTQGGKILGTALSWEPNYEWLHVGLDGGNDISNGLAANNLWANNMVYTGSNGIRLNDAWINDAGRDDWIRLSDPSNIENYTHGFVAKKIWSVENIYAQGYIQNHGANRPVNIEDDLRVNGFIKANSIGYFYQRTSASASAANSDLSASASCDSGDILVSCTSYTAGGGGYSRGNISDLNSCTGYGHTQNSSGVTVYATCFSPDGQ